MYGVLLIPQILLMADAHASTVFPLHTQNPEVIPTAKTMKCLSISTEKSGEVGWGGQPGQSKDLSQLNNRKIQQQQKQTYRHICKNSKRWVLPREGGCLVQAAGNDGPSRDYVEDGEDADLHHQLLQLVNLGSTLLLLDHAPVHGRVKETEGEMIRDNLILKREINPAERKETPRMR